MDLQHANVLLEKITALQKSIGLDRGDISPIERDLMLSYIRQLYEAYRIPASNGVAPSVQPVKAVPVVEVPKPQPIPEPVVIVEVSKPQPAPEPVAVVEPPKPAPAPVVVEAPAPVVAPAPARNIPAAVEALFRHTTAREVSEKLAQQPIADLTKAMTINDKILYANDLFNRSNDALNQALLQLNALPNMEAAKHLLSDLAIQYEWTEGDDRPETAAEFIRLVRRRF